MAAASESTVRELDFQKRAQAFRQAAADGNLVVLRELGVDSSLVNAIGPGSGRTALHWAANNGKVEAVKVLLNELEAGLSLFTLDSGKKAQRI